MKHLISIIVVLISCPVLAQYPEAYMTEPLDGLQKSILQIHEYNTYNLNIQACLSQEDQTGNYYTLSIFTILTTDSNNIECWLWTGRYFQHVSSIHYKLHPARYYYIYYYCSEYIFYNNLKDEDKQSARIPTFEQAMDSYINGKGELMGTILH